MDNGQKRIKVEIWHGQLTKKDKMLKYDMDNGQKRIKGGNTAWTMAKNG